MKRWALIFFVSTLFLFGCQVAFAEMDFQTGFNLDWWTSSGNDDGSQAYLPLQFGYDTSNASLRGFTAYAYSYKDTPVIRNSSPLRRSNSWTSPANGP